MTYAYGGDGNRREQKIGNTERWYNYDGINQISEEYSDGDIRWSQVHDPSRAIGTILGRRHSTNGYHNFHQDHLGSTRLITDLSKNVSFSGDYGPYGDIIRQAGYTAPEHMFTGKAWDQTTGMHYFPYRYLSPQWGGRWTQRDPLFMINGPNLYGYVGGNPTNFVDPMGLAHPAVVIGGVIVAGGALGGIGGGIIGVLNGTGFWRGFGTGAIPGTLSTAGALGGPFGAAAGGMAGGVLSGWFFGGEGFFDGGKDDMIASGLGGLTGGAVGASGIGAALLAGETIALSTAFTAGFGSLVVGGVVDDIIAWCDYVN
ncbi:RHS repeat-associated core domain-containing protein [Candidatus Hydrogenedentota bacterium]